ncbi:hypothetical protein RFI_06828 [Reticulomyxa filosa]|uniref:Uncharacterized protein n=1 Tax=Reticulomyxa filosa TaxID=46433 RepID=X6NVF9_RETFI|nr:hypothetical protein RFI_06828 [Reticulomyxa filosa]|eukprot:ETO30295.1 hypothetical protein RFI_06828 [Reticulomyxa filosa]
MAQPNDGGRKSGNHLHLKRNQSAKNIAKHEKIESIALRTTKSQLSCTEWTYLQDATPPPPFEMEDEKNESGRLHWQLQESNVERQRGEHEHKSTESGHVKRAKHQSKSISYRKLANPVGVQSAHPSVHRSQIEFSSTVRLDSESSTNNKATVHFELLEKRVRVNDKARESSNEENENEGEELELEQEQDEESHATSYGSDIEDSCDEEENKNDDPAQKDHLLSVSIDYSQIELENGDDDNNNNNNNNNDNVDCDDRSSDSESDCQRSTKNNSQKNSTLRSSAANYNPTNIHQQRQIHMHKRSIAPNKAKQFSSIDYIEETKQRGEATKQRHPHWSKTKKAKARRFRNNTMHNEPTPKQQSNAHPRLLRSCSPSRSATYSATVLRHETENDDEEETKTAFHNQYDQPNSLKKDNTIRLVDTYSGNEQMAKETLQVHSFSNSSNLRSQATSSPTNRKQNHSDKTKNPGVDEKWEKLGQEEKMQILLSLYNTPNVSNDLSVAWDSLPATVEHE